VWHAHLSFVDRYQHDVMTYCGNIVEHSPVLGPRALRQYHNAYDKQAAQMKHLEKFVDHEFWPIPQWEKERFET
jgi:hypothetical protein